MNDGNRGCLERFWGSLDTAKGHNLIAGCSVRSSASAFGSHLLNGALLDRLTQHVHNLELPAQGLPICEGAERGNVGRFRCRFILHRSGDF